MGQWGLGPGHTNLFLGGGYFLLFLGTVDFEKYIYFFQKLKTRSVFIVEH